LAVIVRNYSQLTNAQNARRRPPDLSPQRIEIRLPARGAGMLAVTSSGL